MEGTTFGWVIHGGNDSDSQSFFSRDTSDYERLYNLDVLGVRDRGEDDELDVYTEFKENIVRKHDGRFGVNIPWIPGAKLDGINEEQSRRRLQNMDMKLRQKEQLKAEYTHIIEEQLEEGIVERIPSKPRGNEYSICHIRRSFEQKLSQRKSEWFLMPVPNLILWLQV